MTDAETLAAGGLVPAGAKAANADTVGARAYRHPVLPGRVVVRLTAEALAEGDDLEMGVLGFGKAEVRGAVGKERKRPLGFPGWALVHDPKHARHALAVVKELKKWQRRAKSKPRAAKDGIDAIAAKLGKTVPQLLPSFYEEAGRAFIAHGSPTVAASCFGKAREAESVHALEVDEQHRADGFLEFALAGAVTTTALAQYAKELSEHHEPATAYAHFRALCVGRTLGGMPPWAGMPKELRRLATAAKLDPDAEEMKLVEEIIESPSLAKAPGEVWRAYAGPIAALAARSASVRAALLELFPTGQDLDDAWLDLVAFETPPRAGWAAWFDKLTKHLTRRWRVKEIPESAFAVLARLAPALIADGKPIRGAGRWWVELDLVERALELGVPVEPAEDARFDLASWARGAHPRDPVRTAAHPGFGPVLAAATGAAIGGEPFDGASAGTIGFAAAKRAWLAALVERVVRGGLVDVAEALPTLATKVKPAVFAALPDLHARLAAAEIAPALARSLRIGIFDELGWPALEHAAAELGDDSHAVYGGLDAAIVATKTRAIAVDATGRLAVHDLVIPAKQELVALRFIDGQFLVMRKHDYRCEGYWSASPHAPFVDIQTSPHWIQAIALRSAALADGGWMECDRVIRAGDRILPALSPLGAFDGTTGWFREHVDGAHRLRELSIRGERGRLSWPAFLEGGEGALDVGASYVLATGLASSPLGVANGVAGIRRRARDGQHEVTRIDGAVWRGPADVIELLDLPGDAMPRPIVADARTRVATICDPTGAIRGSIVGAHRRAYTRGSVAALPVALWHAMVPRDPAGSARLRAITEADARALLAGVAGGWDPEIAARLVGVIGAVLPEVTHPRLRLGIAGLVAYAAELAVDLAAAAALPVASPTAVAVAAVADEDLHASLGQWLPHAYGVDGRAVAQIAHLGALFGGERTDRRDRAVPLTRVDWFDLALAPDALVTLALAIGTPARRAIAELAAQLARSLPPPEKLRTYFATSTIGIPDYTTGAVWFEGRWHAGNAYAIRHLAIVGNKFRVLEYAPDGVFKPPPGGLQPDPDRRGVARAPLDVAALLAATGTSWSEAAAARLAGATGLSTGEAALLWAGCPNLNRASANFLDKALRETLGLKAKQAAVARDALRAKPLATRLAVIDATGQAGVAALLDGRAVAATAAAWNAGFGARVAVPEALVATADNELHKKQRPAEALAMIAAAEIAPALNVDGTWALTPRGGVIRARSATPLVGQTAIEGPRVFDAEALHVLVVYVPFLFAELPVGHVLRGAAAIAHARGLARLANPALLFEAGRHDDDGKDRERTRAAFLDALGGDSIGGMDDGTTGVQVRGGIAVGSKYWLEIVLRPAELDARTPPALGKLAAQLERPGHSAWHWIDALRSSDYAALVARIAETSVPVGGWEQNALASSPALVSKVAKKLGLGRDAAALYLQYLVLLWPTPKRLAQWNGWTAKQLAAANAELVAHDLVVAAKRARAQRGHFLPGGWEALKAPHPPFETWKLPMYATRDEFGELRSPSGRFLATAPFHLLFERAWRRYQDGDVPVTRR